MQQTARLWLTRLHVRLLRAAMMLRNLAGILRLLLRRDDGFQGRPCLVVTIHSFQHGRYGYQLLNYFSLSGHRIVFYRSLGFLSRLSGYDRMVLNLPGARVWRPRMSAAGQSFPWLRLGDAVDLRPSFRVSAEFRVDLDYFREGVSLKDGFHLPYFVHPLVAGRLAGVTPKKSGSRRGRVLMYGQSDLPIDRERLEGRFGLMGRGEAFDTLSAADLAVFVPQDFQGLSQWLDRSGERTELCLIDSRRVWIPVERWLDVLSGFDFFIATPGYCMPHAHNLMEALAVATIPILQYHKQLHPALTPGRNCLAFSGREDLVRVVDEAMRMPATEVASIRKGVERYYSEHVDPGTVVPRLFRLASVARPLVLFLNAEEFSLEIMDRGASPNLEMA